MKRLERSSDPTSGTLSRRRFLRQGAAAAAAFSIVPRHVLGGAGYVPPSEKLNIAGIGAGGKGASDIASVASENIVALCDVHESHAAATFARHPKAHKYRDFRVMLEKEKSLDAVIVSTPDHTHAVAAMTAIQMGKHVYVQKPLTHSVHEARQLTLAARKHRVATQMGNQGQASEHTRRVYEMIQGGAVGPVREVHVWTDRPNRGLAGVYWPQGIERPTEKPPVPADLSWDLWLGPAPERPYHPAYLPFRWRGWWDFGTGALGDIGCHTLDPVFRALKLEAPLSVQATSTRVNQETYPAGSMVTYRFAARGEQPPVTLIWYDGGLRPARPAMMEDGPEMGPNGTLYVGDQGVMLDLTIFPRSRRESFPLPPKTIPRSPGHYEEWLAACKGGPPGGSNFDWAGPLTEAVLLGNVALRAGLREKLTHASLEWDPEALRVKNLPEADEFLRRRYRDGWHL